MSEFKRWISYLYSYSGEIREKNVGFVKMDVRDGRCRVSIGIKGAYGCDEKGLDIGFYIRQEGRPVRISVGKMRIQGGSGEFCGATEENNLFGTGLRLSDSCGLWLTRSARATFYLTSWEKECLDIRDFLPGQTAVREQKPQQEQTAQQEQMPPSYVYVSAAAVEEAAPAVCEIEENAESKARQQDPVLEELPQPGLWESLCRYYPKASPELRSRGIELLQIRPADIRYLPQRLWHYGSNSFLLHGYYNYRHLVLGRMNQEGKQDYILGVRGVQDDRERFSAGLFGFHSFLPVKDSGREGYWYTQITL